MGWVNEAVQHLLQENFPAYTEDVARRINLISRNKKCADTADEVLDGIWGVIRSPVMNLTLPGSTESEDELNERIADPSGALTEFGREHLRNYVDQARHYESELEALEADDLEELGKRYKASFDTARQRAEARAAQRDIKFFGGPLNEADFDHWARRPSWTLEEAAALSLGKDPRKINTETVESPRFSPVRRQRP